MSSVAVCCSVATATRLLKKALLAMHKGALPSESVKTSFQSVWVDVEGVKGSFPCTTHTPKKNHTTKGVGRAL